MADWVLLNKVIALLLVVQTCLCTKDLLENLKLRRDNPPELNEFLRKILEKKDLFKKIRESARHIQEEREFSQNEKEESNFLSPLVSYLPLSIQKREEYIIEGKPVNDVYPYANNKLPYAGLTADAKDESNVEFVRRDSSYADFNDKGTKNVEIDIKSEVGVRNVPGEKYAQNKNDLQSLNHYVLKRELPNRFLGRMRQKKFLGFRKKSTSKPAAVADNASNSKKMPSIVFDSSFDLNSFNEDGVNEQKVREYDNAFANVENCKDDKDALTCTGYRKKHLCVLPNSEGCDNSNSRYGNTDEKKNTLIDVDEPTSAIEQYELSTKPYDSLSSPKSLFLNKRDEQISNPLLAKDYAQFEAKESVDMIHGSNYADISSDSRVSRNDLPQEKASENSDSLKSAVTEEDKINKLGFQKRSLLQIDSEIDDLKREEQRYGNIDYENGQRYERSKDDQKVRVKRDQESNDNYDAKGWEDDYGEEEDPMGARKLTYDKKKNVQTHFENKFIDVKEAGNDYQLDESVETRSNSPDKVQESSFKSTSKMEATEVGSQATVTAERMVAGSVAVTTNPNSVSSTPSPTSTSSPVFNRTKRCGHSGGGCACTTCPIDISVEHHHPPLPEVHHCVGHHHSDVHDEEASHIIHNMEELSHTGEHDTVDVHDHHVDHGDHDHGHGHDFDYDHGHYGDHDYDHGHDYDHDHGHDYEHHGHDYGHDYGGGNCAHGFPFGHDYDHHEFEHDHDYEHDHGYEHGHTYDHDEHGHDYDHDYDHGEHGDHGDHDFGHDYGHGHGHDYFELHHAAERNYEGNRHPVRNRKLNAAAKKSANARFNKENAAAETFGNLKKNEKEAYAAPYVAEKHSAGNKLEENVQKGFVQDEVEETNEMPAFLGRDTDKLVKRNPAEASPAKAMSKRKLQNKFKAKRINTESVNKKSKYDNLENLAVDSSAIAKGLEKIDADKKLDEKRQANKYVLLDPYKAPGETQDSRKKRKPSKKFRRRVRRNPGFEDDNFMMTTERYDFVYDHNSEYVPVKRDNPIKEWVSAKLHKSDRNQPLENTKRDTIEDGADMEDAIYGGLASVVVDKAMTELSKHNQLSSRFSSGLDINHVKEQLKDLEMFRDSENQKDVQDTENLLHRVMSVLDKIIVDQVKRNTCKRISPQLKTFLKEITNVKNLHPSDDESDSEEDIVPPSAVSSRNLHGNNQKAFIFKHNQAKIKKEQDAADLQDQLNSVNGLIKDYNNLRPIYQHRTRRVKNYLKKHLKLLKYISNAQQGYVPSSDVENSRIRTNRKVRPKLMNYHPSELHHQNNQNEDVANDYHHNPRNSFDKRNSPVSLKYKKLADAVDYWKKKRQKDKRIGELYGEGAKNDNNAKDDELTGFINNEKSDISKVGFAHLVPFNLG